MPLIAVGLNHQTAPLALREKVALDAAALPAALSELSQLGGVQEAALLSTSNRTEIYAQVDDGHEAAVGHWLARHHGLEPGAIEGYLYQIGRAHV